MNAKRVEVERKIQGVMHEQYSLITTPQALECGMTYKGLGREERAARLERLARGLYRDARQPKTFHQSVLAAVLIHRSPALAGGATAARLYGVDGYYGDDVLLYVPRGGHHCNPLATVHQLEGLDQRDRRLVDNIPCLAPETTLLTLAAAPGATYDRIESALVALSCKGLLTVKRVAQRIDRFEGKGRKGIVLLRQVADQWHGRQLPGSAKELELGRILDAAGVGPVSYQVPVTVEGGVTLHADIGLPGRAIVVEYQSDAHHSTRSARRNDSSRILQMRAAGLEVLPATQDDIDNNGRHLLAAIHAIDRSRVA